MLMNKVEFIEETKKIGIEINQHQLEQLEQFYEMLADKNKKMNLTNIIEVEDVYLKHFYDSLTITRVCNLNNININERRRELATIKVLGFYDLELAEYVYRENILLTIIGSLFGVVMGTFLHRYLIVTVEVDDIMFGRNIAMSSYIYSVLITIAFSIFVNFVMFFKLRKINMVESLKSVE